MIFAYKLSGDELGFLCFCLVIIVLLFFILIWRLIRMSNTDFLNTKPLPFQSGTTPTPVSPRPYTVADYLVDPDTTVPYIYVPAIAIIPTPGYTIHGFARYTETPTEANTIKLVRSGTGFRVYGHDKVPNGTWLSCR